jgi:mono/diheme cytochrome c family protein
MNITAAIKPLGCAALAAVVAMTSAFTLGAVLRREAIRDSRQQLEVERWLEPGTPTSAALVAHGRTLFLDSCAHCHGADARGDEGPDLHDVQVSDRYIGNIITHGIPHEMPSFAKKLGAPEIGALTAYIRSLR